MKKYVLLVPMFLFCNLSFTATNFTTNIVEKKCKKNDTLTQAERIKYKNDCKKDIAAARNINKEYNCYKKCNNDVSLLKGDRIDFEAHSKKEKPTELNFDFKDFKSKNNHGREITKFITAKRGDLVMCT